MPAVGSDGNPVSENSKNNNNTKKTNAHGHFSQDTTRVGASSREARGLNSGDSNLAIPSSSSGGWAVGDSEAAHSTDAHFSDREQREQQLLEHNQQVIPSGSPSTLGWQSTLGHQGGSSGDPSSSNKGGSSGNNGNNSQEGVNNNSTGQSNSQGAGADSQDSQKNGENNVESLGEPDLSAPGLDRHTSAASQGAPQLDHPSQQGSQLQRNRLGGTNKYPEVD